MNHAISAEIKFSPPASGRGDPLRLAMFHLINRRLVDPISLTHPARALTRILRDQFGEKPTLTRNRRTRAVTVRITGGVWELSELEDILTSFAAVGATGHYSYSDEDDTHPTGRLDLAHLTRRRTATRRN